MQTILWFEVAVKAVAGLLLFVAPITLSRLAGFARTESGFWPRLAGALLAGIAMAVFAGLAFPAAHGGLGPAGLIAINLCGAVALIGPLILGKAAPTRRGRLFILATALTLLTLAFAEIAHI